MRYLITGGCGFLGSNLARHVLSRGEPLCVVDNLSRVGGDANLHWLRKSGEFRFENRDVRDATALATVVREFRPETVFHLAGQVAMTTSIADPRLDFEINALGTFNLLEAVRAHAPAASVVYSSTNKVYGDLEWVRYKESPTRYVTPDFPNGFDERVPISFQSPYGCSKGAADQYMLDYARMFGLNTVVFRHSSIFGNRQFSTFDQGWVGWFCHKAIETRANADADPFTISGNGKQVRDVLFADDAIRLYLAAATLAPAVKGRAFNVGGGIANSLSLLELFAMLEKTLDVRLRYQQQPPRASDQRVFVADTTAASKAFGWAPTTSTRRGVTAMLEWLQRDGHDK